MTALFSELGRRFLGGVLLLASPLFVAACSNEERGEVIVVVSTDMSLPTDLDWLDWTVTDGAHVIEHRGRALPKSNSLPGTVAIVAGKDGGESVTVKLEGRLGGMTGAVRVSREAQLTMPQSGQKMLKLPLNWLCSEVNLPAPGCDLGTTCSAGRCVSSLVRAPLADYVPLDSLPCFDPLACTLNSSVWSLATPSRDETTPDCNVPAHVVPAPPLSVALVLDPGVVGITGVCAPNLGAASSSGNAAPGFCFLPLNQDESADGWQLHKNAQGQSVVRLPTAVCDAVALGKVSKVALTHTGCPAKTSAHPLCNAAPLCVTSASSCPATFPSSWTGYSCSGPEHPSAKYCGVSDNDPELPPVVLGHSCCTDGQSSADPSSLLIDDMSEGPLIKFPHAPNQVAGSWFTASDDTAGLPLSPPQTPKSLFTYRVIPPVTPSGGPSFDRAACFTMPEGFAGHYANEGFTFATQGVAAVPIDVSQFSGITFWAKVTSVGSEAPPTIGVFFPDRDTDTEHASICFGVGNEDGGTGTGNCNSFRKLLDLTSDWQSFSVRWEELSQALDFGMQFDRLDQLVYAVTFQALGPGSPNLAAPFDFCVSQIYFTR